MTQNKMVRSKGYSLLEVLVTLAMVGVTTAVIAYSYQQSTQLQTLLDGRLVATILGSSKLAELEAGSERGSSGKFTSPYTQFQWIAREEQTPGGTGMIVLTVQWSGGNRNIHQKIFTGYLREQ